MVVLFSDSVECLELVILTLTVELAVVVVIAYFLLRTQEVEEEEEVLVVQLLVMLQVVQLLVTVTPIVLVVEELHLQFLLISVYGAMLVDDNHSCLIFLENKHLELV